MLTDDRALPTPFAISLGETTGLLLKSKTGVNHHDYTQLMIKMKCFQQMAVVSKFDDAIIAYHGMELSAEQKESLKIIYKSTRPWMLGHVVGVLLNKLDTKMANKDFAESVRTIVEQLTNENAEATQATKGLLVKLSKQ